MQEFKILSDNNLFISYKDNDLFMELILGETIYHWMEKVKHEKRLQSYFINAIYAIRRTIKKHNEGKNE